MTRDKPPLDAIAPLLIGVQKHPERDVSLESLAREWGYSPSHFHRLFAAAVGETPKEHVERLRLERAAYRLSVTRTSILDIALSVGFRNHETFTRAFRRTLGMTPTAWRRDSLRSQKERMERLRTFRGQGCKLSEATFLTLKPMTLLAMRRIGSYENVGLPPMSDEDPYWSAVAAFAKRQGLAIRPLPISICYDAPKLTPPHLQHLDACMPLVRKPRGLKTSTLRCLSFAGGLYGAIEHRGPYDTMIQAYRTLAGGIRRSGRFRFRDGPPIQIFREWSTTRDPSQNLTEVYFPVEKSE
jgi:AraC family transcriptional regulator